MTGQNASKRVQSENVTVARLIQIAQLRSQFDIGENPGPEDVKRVVISLRTAGYSNGLCQEMTGLSKRQINRIGSEAGIAIPEKVLGLDGKCQPSVKPSPRGTSPKPPRNSEPALRPNESITQKATETVFSLMFFAKNPQVVMEAARREMVVLTDDVGKYVMALSVSHEER